MKERSRLMWVARKLASQDAAYLPRRLGYAVRKRVVDRIYPSRGMRAQAALRKPLAGDPGVLRAFLRGRPGRWHWDPEQLPLIAREVPDEVQARTVAAADALVSRRFTFRGHPPLWLSPIDWSASPRGDRAWTWDLNRHGWFVTLGFAHWYTGDRRYLDSFAEVSALWIDQNLNRVGRLPWDTPFEVGYRVNAWIWAFQLFGYTELWPADAAARFLHGLGQLAEYLYQTIEYHSPGNHVLLEAKALALCGELFPEFAGAARWRAKGWRFVEQELQRQICMDGVHAERSTLYHRIVAGELAELWLVAQRNQLRQAQHLREVVGRMAEFEAWIDQGDGSYPLFGDACAEDPYFRFSSQAVIAAVESGAMPMPRADREDYLWWATSRFRDLAVGMESSRAGEHPTGAMKFPEGGYFVSRSGGSRPSVLVWDCGPAGYAANRKHAHLDALAFTLSVNGVPTLIDPGVESAPRPEPFRGTRAHNTVVVDGLDQALLAARGEIWSPPQSQLLLWATSGDCDVMQGSHDGYLRLPDPVCHTRTIVARHGAYWLILDHLVGHGIHSAEQRYHLAPGAILTPDHGSRFEGRVDGVGLTFAPIAFRMGATPNARVEQGLAEQVYGQPTTIPVLSVSCEHRLPITLGLLIVPGTAPIAVTGEEMHESDSTVVAVRFGSVNERIVVGYGAPRSRELLPGWHSDAQVAILRSGADDQVRDVLVAGATMLVCDGTELLARTEPPAMDDSVRRVATSVAHA